MKAGISGLSLSVLTMLFIGIGAAPANADVSLNDVLKGLCYAPACIEYPNANKAILSSDDTSIGVKDWAPQKKDGPTLLFIHGYPHGQGLWVSQVLSSLRSKYRLVTVDTRGGGDSGVPAAGNYTFENYGDDIQAVIRDLKLKNVILVGHSYGGIVINSYIKRHGTSQLKGVVGVAAVPDLVNIQVTLEAFGLIGGTLDPNNQLAGTIAFVNGSIYKQFPQFFIDLIVNMDLEVPFAGRLGQITSAAAQSNLVSSIEAINVPTLLIHGVNDTLVLPANSDFWQAHLISAPSVQRIDLPGTGHLPQLESPFQVNAALDNFAKQFRP